jgi:hypothetical protein
MSNQFTNKAPEANETHQFVLESRFIDEYLRMKGCRWEDLSLLPEAQAKRLMIEASRYASLKLAEHEARAKMRKEISYE